MEIEPTTLNIDSEITPLDPTLDLTPKSIPEFQEITEEQVSNVIKPSKFNLKSYWFPEKPHEEGDSAKTQKTLKYLRLKAIVDAPNETMVNLMSSVKDFASKAFDHASEAAASAVSLIQTHSARALDNINGYIDKQHGESQPPKER